MTAAAARPGVLLYCQHSVGLGHLVRSAALAGALAGSFDVVLATGGALPGGFVPPAGVELLPLAPIGSADERGSVLESLDPGRTLEEALDARRAALLGVLERRSPAAVVVEQFPFGRRKFAGELLPLLEAARRRRPAPAVVCSVRDLLVRRAHGQAARDERTTQVLEAYFDAVVVHADPRVARLADTFPGAGALSIPVHHLGYVVPGGPCPRWRRPSEPVVVVSAGGGRSGGPLLRCAAAAHLDHLDRLGVTTRLVTGPFLPEAAGAALRAAAGRSPSLQVERFVPDLCTVLAGASVSVGQCGYNSALDVLRCGVPAVVVPFSGDDEQPERARRLARLGVVQVLSPDELAPEPLAGAVLRLLEATPSPAAIDLDGAAATARLVGQLVAGRRAPVG
ncbi:MAG: glycosyltransferase [Actinomycetota bacterium]|nr:glycosyltransferase [Actinomycetota bacterium]